MEDFSTEHLGVIIPAEKNDGEECYQNLWLERMKGAIEALNIARVFYIRETDPELKKDYWWQMIQLLPSSYNQTRNVMMNYEVLANIYKSRNNHKLDEWREFCSWIEMLPYSELIVGSPSLKCVEVGKAALDGIQKSIAKAVQDSKKKDLVEVTRCINCSYYISADDMKNDEMYKGYENLLGCDGICTSTDKWTYETDFCSSGKEKW